MDAPFHITEQDETRFHHDLLLVVFGDPAQYRGAVSIPILDRSVTFPVETGQFLRVRQLSALGNSLSTEDLDT